MNELNAVPVHWSFWLIGAFLLIWNVLDCIIYLVQMNPDILASNRESERAIVEGRPAWS